MKDSTNSMISIRLNEDDITVSNHLLISQLLESIKSSPINNAVFINGEFLHIDEFDTRVLKEGDNLKVFSFLLGG